LLSEALGAFILILFGTGTIVAASRVPGASPVLSVAMAFGCGVFLAHLILAPLGWGHFNPAVSLAAGLKGQMDAKDLLPAMLAQFAGGLLASLLIKILVSPFSLGVCSGSVGGWRAFGVETLASMMFIFFLLRLSARVQGPLISALAGLSMAVNILWAGPLSGASLNPARGLAPALVGWEWGGQWIAILAPFVGAWLAVQLDHALAQPKQGR
jgi:aquaporin Z